MPRKRAVQTPGAAPVAEADTVAQVADTAEQANAGDGAADDDDTGAEAPAAAAPAPAKVGKPARAESRELPDPATLAAPVLTERGWLCPSPKPAA